MRIYFPGSSGRGLAFTSSEEVEVKDEKTGKPVIDKKTNKPKTKTVIIEKFYTGNVGGDVSKHDANYYKGIAKEIMDKITNGTWPAIVTISITRGGKNVDEPWTQREDRKDFLHGGYF